MKRVLSLALVLVMVFTLLPLGAMAEETTITRAEWIQSLVEAFDMTVEDETAPDNYFSDVSSKDSFYIDVLIAEEFGVIDIPAGTEFRPNDSTTREFAAETLNYCLGFQLNDKDEYTFAECESVEHPDDIQISINRGWFELVDGKFLPEKAINSNELEVMMADVADVLENERISYNYNSTFTLAKGTIEIPEGTVVSIEETQVIITDCPEKISKGDFFVVYSNGLPCAFKAEAIRIDGTKTVIDATAISDDSVITSVDAQGCADADFTQFTPLEGTQIIYIDENTGEEYTDPVKAEKAVKKAAAKGTKSIKRSFSVKIDAKVNDTLSISGKFSLKDPKVNYKFDSKTKTALVELVGKYELSLSAKGDITETAATKSLDLVYFGVPGIGGVKLSMKYELSGSASLMYSGDLSFGMAYADGISRKVMNFQTGSFSLNLEATLKTGINVSLGINDVPGDIVAGYIYAEIGATGKLKRTTYLDNETPHKCVHTAMYLYMEYGAKVKVKFGIVSSELAYKAEVWHDKNSPVRVVHHYEDGIEVAKCTRGNTYDNYFTSANSNFWGSGWSGANGAWGLNANGVPVQVYTYSLDENGNATVTGFSGNATALTIPSALDGHTVVAIGDGAFKNNTQIRSVNMPDTVTEIGNCAFQYCSKLNNISLPEGLTELGWAAFDSCTSIVSVNIPKTLTTAHIQFDNLDSYSNGPFVNCSGLKNVEIEQGITSIPAFLFAGCTGIEQINIPDTVTVIGTKAFLDCTALKSVYGGESITLISNRAFQYCSKLNNISLPEGLTELGWAAFDSCTSIVSVNIPKTLTTAHIQFDNLDSYSNGPFVNCSGLKNVEIEQGITSIPAFLFAGCTGIEQINIPDTVTVIGTKAFLDCSKLKSVRLNNGLQTISDKSFSDCICLQKIEIPNSVTSMGTYIFSNCTSLESVNIPQTRKNITTGLFKNCSSLKKIEFPDSVITIRSSAFEGCASLADIVLPRGLEIIESNAFRNCDSIKEIIIPGGVSTIGSDAIRGCDNLQKVIVSNGVKSIDSTAFAANMSLTEVSLPNSITSIGESAFNNCDALETITIPDSVTSIGNYIFAYCDKLKNVSLGTGITTIPKQAFFECLELESIVLPYRTTTVNSKAFGNCIKLNAMTVPRSVTNIATDAVSYRNKTTIYGVAGTYAETFANEIGAKFVDRQVNATVAALGKTELQLYKGNSAKLNLTVTPADFTDEVAWKSSDTSVATIADDGTVKAVGIGTATIKVTVGNISTSCKVTVVQPVTSISLNKTSLSMGALSTYQLTATASPSNAYDKTIAWSSSDTSVATVSDSGLVTAVGKGTAKITATATAVSGISKTCTVTVTNNAVVADSAEQLESPHNYANSCSDIWIYSVPNAKAIRATFDQRTNIEDGFDYLYIYDVNGNQVGKYTGTELAGKTLDIDGNTIKIKLVSDNSGNEWGFKVVSVTEKPAEHTHSYTAEVTAPTCIDKGYTTYTCACGDSYKDNYVNALGHKTENRNAKAATCTADGYTGDEVCKVCGQIIHSGVSVKALGHAWDEGKVTIQPTEEKDGVKTFTCTRCGETKTEAIPAIDHVHNYIKAVTAPTCMAEGYTTYTCSACGDSYKDDFTAKAEHKTAIENVMEATCTVEGYTGDKICKVCGTVVEQGKAVAKLAHSYQSTVIEPTAEAQGYTKHTCTKCGDSYIDNYTVAAPVPTISIKTDTGKPTLKWAAVDGAAKYEVYRATSKTGNYSKYYTTSSTSYTNTSAVPGATYYYKVKAITANGNESEFSVIKSITCDCAQPVATITTTASSGKPTLKWSAVDGATKYEIYRATSSTGTYSKYYTTTSTSYTNSSAVAGSTYYYKVKAICGKSSYGDSAFSAVKSITCDCAQPVVTISTTASSGKPTLKWSAVDGATKYEIYRATSKTGTYTKMYTTSSTSYTNSSAVAGKTYYYKVKALCGKSSYGDSAFSAVKSITCDCARPVVSITTSSGHPKLSWKAVDGATKYEVYRATSSSGTYTKLGTTSNLSYTNSSAKAGTTYYYKVIAVCGASSYGNSAYSTVVSIKAK